MTEKDEGFETRKAAVEAQVQETDPVTDLNARITAFVGNPNVTEITIDMPVGVFEMAKSILINAGFTLTPSELPSDYQGNTISVIINRGR